MPTTITLPSKFTQDENGNKFAPITTPNAVRWGDGTNLNDHLGGTQADWNETDSSDPSYIQNKPSALPANGGNAATVNNHTVLSDVPANAVFTDTTYSVMGASGSSHASGLVPDPGSTAGTTKFLREDGTWQVPTADVSGKEDKMSIVNAGLKTSYSPVINTLTKIGMQSSLTVTLPSISTDTDKVQSLVLLLETYPNYSPNLSIVGQSGDIIYFPPDFTIEANKSYEINCMWVGNDTWIVASHEIFYGGA